MSPKLAYQMRDLLPPSGAMLDEVLRGLAMRRKQISPKYFYDARGCELFDLICKLPEYYPTRTELGIMGVHAGAMADALGSDCAVIELGCGNSAKTRYLLEALCPSVFVAIDIAREQLEASCTTLAREFPDTRIIALRADFAHPVALPLPMLGAVRRRILCWPGSTIGNFTPAQARLLLRRWRHALGAHGGLLIGVDLKKDQARLNAAYNDAQGVTAAFNLNVLTRLNKELAANFDVAAFQHRAVYSAARSRVEMHLVSTCAQQVTVGGSSFAFRAGEAIHTENSYKYTIEDFAALGRTAGYLHRQCWTDDERLFAVHYLTAGGSTTV